MSLAPSYIENNALASFLFRSSPHLLLLIDKNCVVVDANIRAKQVFRFDFAVHKKPSICRVLSCINFRADGDCATNGSICTLHGHLLSTFKKREGVTNLPTQTIISLPNTLFTCKYKLSTFFVESANLVLVQMDDSENVKSTLDEMANKYSSLLGHIESGTDAIWTLDENLNLVVFNANMQAKFEQLFGVTFNIGDNFILKMPLVTQDVWRSRYLKVLGGIKLREIETVEKGGENQLLEIYFNPSYVGNKVSGISCLAKDITLVRRSELEVKKNVVIALSQIENSYDHIWSIDTNFNIVLINSAMKRSFKILFGIEISSGMNALPELSSDTGQLWRERYEKALDGEHFTVVDHFQLEGIPEYFRISFTPIVIDRQVVGVSCVATDITQLKRNEDSLLRSELKLKEAQEVAKIGSWEMNYQSNIGVWSDEVYRILGLKKGEVIPNIECFLNHVRPEERAFPRRVYLEHLKHKKPYDIEYKITTNAGEIKYVMIRCKSEFASDGSIVSTFGTVQDITEQKQIELELHEANAMKTKLFSVIAHDLRSPFNSLLGFSQLLATTIEEKDFVNATQYTEIINKSAEKIFVLLNNLLDWSNSQIGRNVFFPELVDTSFVVRDVADLAADTLSQKDVYLRIEGSLPNKLFCDKNMLSTILRNLISNAIKFSFPKGTVLLKVESFPKYALFLVHDEGVGISKSELDILFNNSVPYSSVGTNNEKGTGLGLILCKEFVERHGGRIWAESERGKGAGFYFTIPY